MALDPVRDEMERTQYELRYKQQEADRARQVAVIAEGALHIISNSTSNWSTTAKDALAAIRALRETSR